MDRHSQINHCPITGSFNKIKYLDLGNIPLVNNLCLTKEESLICDKFPLEIQLFIDSNLSCLTEVINKDSLFLNYLYQSGVNKPYLNHCSMMYDFLSQRINIKNNDFIVDVGGNDGSLLMEFRKKNRRLHYVNVDCSKSFIDINKQNNIEYISEYFDESISLPHKAKVITSTNVFQHTEQIRSFVRGIEKNLSDDGVWCLEFPYILTTSINDNYDQIYHEHIYYFCLKNIIDLLAQEGLKVVNVSYHNMHAGTLRVLSVKKSSLFRSNDTIMSFINLERVLTPEYYIKWGWGIRSKIEEFTRFIYELSKHKTIIGFGAAAKGCIFLNTCKIDHNIMKYIIDDTPFKQNKFIPGTGIEVVDRSILESIKPDYILILAHNFKDYIINSLKGQYDGKFITMFPNIKIL